MFASSTQQISSYDNLENVKQTQQAVYDYLLAEEVFIESKMKNLQEYLKYDKNGLAKNLFEKVTNDINNLWEEMNKYNNQLYNELIGPFRSARNVREYRNVKVKKWGR